MKLVRFAVALASACLGISMLSACGGGGGSGSPVAQSIGSIVVAPSPVTMGMATTQQFTATARDQSGNAMSGVTLVWSSSNSSVATINGSGMASALAVGTTNITASAQGITSAAVSVTVVQATSVTGTAATGAPMPSALVTLKDSRGTARTATTDATGHFSIDTTALATPFILRVQPANGPALYSVSAEASAGGVINITPLTDLIVRSWYGARHIAVDAAFADPVVNSLPSPSSVEVVNKLFSSMMQQWLVQAGLDVATFNLISSPFNADSTGLDGVLDKLDVDTDASTLTVTSGSTVQKSTVSYGATPPRVTIQTDVSSLEGSSSTVVSTVVPVAAAEQSVVDGVNAALAALANTANSASGNLSSADLRPYFSDDFWDGGLSWSYVADSMVKDLIGRKVSFDVRSIDAIDTGSGRLTATIDRVLSSGSVSRIEKVQYAFKKVGDTWLLYGDRRAGLIELHSEMRTHQGAVTSGSGPAINARVLNLPQGAPPSYDYVHSGTISGGGLWSDRALVRADPEDAFFTLVASSGPLSAPIAAGTPFTFDLKVYVDGALVPVSYELRTKAFTSEAISITNLTGTTIADAHAGQPLTVQWTLPRSYAIENVRLKALVTGTPQGATYHFACETAGPLLAATATSGSLTIPAKGCDNQPTTAVDVYVVVEGVSGERSVAVYSYR